MEDRRNRHAYRIPACRPAWNKGRIVGQKRPLEPEHVWAIRDRLEIAGRTRESRLGKSEQGR